MEKPQIFGYNALMLRGVWWWTLSAAVVGCNGGYPIAVSSCDEQCELLVRACPSPPYDPAECVAGCEDQARNDTRTQCADEYEALLECLRPKPVRFCLSEGPNTFCTAEERAYDVCNNGGEEAIARSACSRYCSSIAHPKQDCAEDERLACADDCLVRGLGRADCEAEQNAAISCFVGRSTEDPNACGAWQSDRDAENEVSCWQERGRLAACGLQ